jgi:hypothetical protein
MGGDGWDQVKMPDGREAREPREAWSFGDCSERRKRETRGARAMHAVAVQECRAEARTGARSALRSPEKPLFRMGNVSGSGDGRAVSRGYAPRAPMKQLHITTGSRCMAM